jgi:hypothetical protein
MILPQLEAFTEIKSDKIFSGSHDYHSLMMGAEKISETLDFDSELTWLAAQEDCIN